MIWNDLVKIAHVGTDRISSDIELENNKLSELLKKIPFKTTEEKILSYSSISAIYQESGKLPKKLNEKIEHENIIEDKRKYINFSESLISDIFQNETEHSSTNNIQKTFLTELKKRNELVPDKFIIKFLEIGAKNKNLRDSIVPVLNKLALFISKKNPKWDYIYDIDSNLEYIWSNSNKKTKINILKQNLENRSDFIIDLIFKSWESLKKEEKEDILDVLFTNYKLDQNIIPIFELASNDKNKDIKFKGITFLSSTNKKNDKYSEIMTEIYEVIDNSIKITKIKSKDKEYKIKVDMPATYSQKLLDAFSDGKLNITSSYFFRYFLIPQIPLSYWEKKFDLTADDIVNNFIRNNLDSNLNDLSVVVIKEENKEWAKSFFINKINAEQGIINLLDNDFKQERLKKILNEIPIDDIKNKELLDKKKDDFQQLDQKEQNLYNSYDKAINLYSIHFFNILSSFNEFSYEISKNIFDNFIILLKSKIYQLNIFNILVNKLDINLYPYIKNEIEKNNLDRIQNKDFFENIFDIIELKHRMLEEFKK